MKTRTGFYRFLWIVGWMGLAGAGYGAVSSTGELNVVNDDSGRVPTAARAPLVLTLLVDRSKAEPGEEIKIIEVQLPAGFSITPANLTQVLTDAVETPFQPEVAGGIVRFVLDDAIDHFRSSVIEAFFAVQTPDIPQKDALFRVAIRNTQRVQIGEFIKPGEIDGNPKNNNDYTLEVFPNVPPATPKNLSVVADSQGENDALIAWEKVADADVKGYLIVRDNTTTLDVVGADTTTFRDVNVPPGAHAYVVAAYKSKLVVSPATTAQTVNLPPDTKAPAVVPSVGLAQVAQGTEIRWKPSPAPDVVAYSLFLAVGSGTPQTIRSEPSASEKEEYTFLYREKLPVGRYQFTVVAEDEAGNRSAPVGADLLLLDTPFPNPFTPLGSPPFNRVTFPLRAIPDAEGDLRVKVFDLRGRLIWEDESAGADLQWDGKNASGELMRSGVYVYQIEVGGLYKIGTIVLIR